MKDYVGTEIMLGDRIAYAVRRGYIAALKSGIVKQIEQKVDRTAPTITVEIDSTKYDPEATAPPYFKPYKRLVHLSYPDRIVVLT